MRSGLEGAWRLVAQSWLDEQASAVEVRSIAPLLRILEQGQCLNDDHRSKSEACMAEAVVL